MRLSLCLLFAAAGLLAAEAPPAIWEGSGPVAQKDLAPTLAKLKAAKATLPPELAPAVDFHRLLLCMRAGAPMVQWRGPVGKFLAAPEKTPMAEGLRELARAYEARARMAEIDAALRQHYRHHAKFPATLADIRGGLVKAAQTDPWGDEWNYTPAAPKKSPAKFSAQRYTLGPSKHPTVRPLAETVTKPAPTPKWKIDPKRIGGQPKDRLTPLRVSAPPRETNSCAMGEVLPIGAIAISQENAVSASMASSMAR